MGDRIPIRAPRGTDDVLSPDSARWHRLLLTVAGVTSAAGFGRLRSPVIEDAELVRRIVGDGRAIELADRADEQGLALTPGVAAAAARAFAEHQPATPWKAWSLLPSLTRRPHGALEQRNEVGVQALGSTDPDLDVEVITVAIDVLDALGVARPTLVLNSVGTVSDRRRYVETLRTWLVTRHDDLAESDRPLAATAPLQVLASRDEVTRAVVADAPRAIDGLSAEGRSHLDAVREGVGAAGIDFLFDHRVAGPTAHWVHVAFEVQSGDETSLLAGSRHEGMVEDLGGPSTPGVGWSSTVETLLTAAPSDDGDGDGVAPLVEVFVVDLTGGSAARDLTRDLRRAGIPADRAFDDRSMRAQMKAADRSGARLALIIGEQEQAQGVVALRCLRDESEEQTTVPAGQVIEAVRDALAAT